MKKKRTRDGYRVGDVVSVEGIGKVRVTGVGPGGNATWRWATETDRLRVETIR